MFSFFLSLPSPSRAKRLFGEDLMAMQKGFVFPFEFGQPACSMQEPCAVLSAVSARRDIQASAASNLAMQGHLQSPEWLVLKWQWRGAGSKHSKEGVTGLGLSLLWAAREALIFPYILWWWGVGAKQTDPRRFNSVAKKKARWLSLKGLMGIDTIVTFVVRPKVPERCLECLHFGAVKSGCG